MDKIKPFEYWVQKTLPAVYDDSLSYYQLLAKIVHHLNTIGDTQNEVIDKVKELMNWFDNLDVQDEINAKLDKMAEDGTLDQIINHNIFNDLNQEIANLDSKIEDVESTTTQQINDLTTNMNNQLNSINQSLSEKIESSRKVSFDRVKFIAHRGYSGLGPENSKHAFYFAGTKRGSFWGCETDIRFTKDGEPVCMHDATIDRTTNGTGYVSDMLLSELRQYEIDYEPPSQVPINPVLYFDKKIPTLSEFLEIMNTINVVPIIELKEDGDILKVVNTIRKYGFEKDCIIISGSPYLLMKARQYSPKIKMMFIVGELSQAEIDWALTIGNCGINMSYSILNDSTLTLCRNHDLDVGVWTVNNVSDVERAIRLGVNYITTDNGAGKFVNKEKRIALTTINNKLAVSQQFSSEYATLSWDETQQAVIVKYEYPFTPMTPALGTGAFISRHTGTMLNGYEFYINRELYDGFYLHVRKNGQVINPLSNLTETIWVNILAYCY